MGELADLLGLLIVPGGAITVGIGGLVWALKKSNERENVLLKTLAQNHKIIEENQNIIKNLQIEIKGSLDIINLKIDERL